MTLFALVRSPKRQHAGQAAGFAAVAIATAAFIGWWVSLPLLSSWGSGFATVKPMVALCLVALGLALMHPGKNSRFAFAVGLAGLTKLSVFIIDRRSPTCAPILMHIGQAWTATVKPWLCRRPACREPAAGRMGGYHASFLDKGGRAVGYSYCFDTWYGSGGPSCGLSRNGSRRQQKSAD